MTGLALDNRKQIGYAWHADMRWLIVVGAIETLTDLADAAGYLWNIRDRDLRLAEPSKGYRIVSTRENVKGLTQTPRRRQLRGTAKDDTP